MRIIITIFFFLLSFQISFSQKNPPFWNEIQQFKKEDSVKFPGKGKILFTGSSTIRLWKNIQDDFPGFEIINRGFGGSTLVDMIAYVDDIITPYAPKQLLIYCGENDIASSDTVKAATIINRFKILFNQVRGRFPDLPIAFISFKPSPSRRKFFPTLIEGNKQVKKFLKKKKKTKYIDVYNAMLNPDGSVMTDLFTKDSLHMNAKGYVIWKKVIEPYLMK